MASDYARLHPSPVLQLRAHLSASVALLLAPLAARAQDPAQDIVLHTYTLSGCADGPVAYGGAAGARAPISGQVACFTGTAAVHSELYYYKGVGVPALYLETAINAAFDPAFTGTTVGINNFPVPYYTIGGADGCAYDSCLSEFFLDTVTGGPWVVGEDRTLRTRSQINPLLKFATPGSVRDLNYGTLYLRYRLAATPDSTYEVAQGTLAFTATPEPSTCALAWLGGLALVGVVRRRNG